MKKTIAFVLSLFLLSTFFTGCGGRGNVSDDENGKITDNTTHTETTMPTTVRPTTEIPSTTESTSKVTEETTEKNDLTETDTFPDENTSESYTDETESGTYSDSDNGNGRNARSGNHSGPIGGSGRF